MSKRDGHQKGPQQHPEGGHGDRTHSKIVETLHQNTHKDPEKDNKLPRAKSFPDGKNHIYEDRQQHDEADKNSEKDRLNKDKSKGRA